MDSQFWLTNLIQDIKVLSENTTLKVDADKFKPVSASITYHVLDKSQLQDTIENMADVTGWVQATSEVQTLYKELINVDSVILNGEWVIVDNSMDYKTSYLLEYMGDYKWSLQVCELNFTAKEQFTHLAERVLYREVGAKNKRSLVYQKLWTYQDNAPVANMAFFTGFDS